jgi:hypothetical protein
LVIASDFPNDDVRQNALFQKAESPETEVIHVSAPEDWKGSRVKLFLGNLASQKYFFYYLTVTSQAQC